MPPRWPRCRATGAEPFEELGALALVAQAGAHLPPGAGAGGGAGGRASVA